MPDSLPNSAPPVTLANPVGFDEDPLIKLSNQKATEAHVEQSAPIINALTKTISPNATPEERIQGSRLFNDISKNQNKQPPIAKNPEDQIPGDAPGSNDFKLSDLFGTMENTAKSFRGGADQRVEAYDANNNKYYKVYNQRTSEANPFGEFRRYESFPYGKPLTNKEIQDAGIITSIKEIPLDHQIGYKNAGVTSGAAAVNQAEYGNRTANLVNYANASAPQLLFNSQREKELANDLGKYSKSPQVALVIANQTKSLASTQNDVKNTTETINKFSTDKASSDDTEDFLKKAASAGAGPDILKGHLEEGKGWVKSNGQKLSSAEARSLSSNYATSRMNQGQIESTKQDKEDAATLLSAGLDQSVIDKIKEHRDISFVTAKIQNDFERMGYNIQRPTVPHEQSNSFVYAGAKAIQNELFAKLVQKFAEKGSQIFQANKSPPVGAVELSVNNDPDVQQLRVNHKNDLINYLKSKEDVYKQINENPNTANIISQLNPVPAVPPEKTPSAPKPTIESKPSGSVAPSERKAALVKKESKQDLLNKLFPK